MKTTQILLLNGLVIGALSVGCQREDTITTYRAPKEVPAMAAAPMDQGAMPGGMPAGHPAMPAGAGASPQAQSAEAPLTWTLPAGWTQAPAGEMRFANFQVSAQNPALMTTVISMPPGQPLLPNLNRWEGQLGLTPSSADDAAKKVKTIDVSGTPVQTVELVGPTMNGQAGASMLAAFAERPDRTWYFKLMGSSDEVAAQKPAFEAFVKSLKFGGGAPASATPDAAATPALPAAHPAIPAGAGGIQFGGALPAAADAGDHPGIEWAAPKEWVAQPAKAMRVASWRTSADEKAAEIIVSSFGTGAFGDMLANVNRWRGMAGLTPVTDLKDVKPEEITVGSTKATVYDFAGSGAGANRVRVLLLPKPDGSAVYFFRLQGSADAVGASQKAFDAFVQSIKLSQ